MLPTRNSSSTGVSSGAVSSSSCGRQHRHVGVGLPAHGVEQLLEPLGEDLHLQLLQRDADRAPGTRGLEVEGAVARLADGAGDEALRRVEEVELAGHALSLGAPVPPPTAASELAFLRRPFFGGIRSPTPPPVSLTRTTKGRCSV